MTTWSLTPFPVLRFVDSNGAALSGGKLFTYIAGTTTKQTTYTDSTGGTPNTNPVILNARGECNVWLPQGQSFKFVLSPSTDTDPPTNPIWTVDNIQPPVDQAALTAGITVGSLTVTNAAAVGTTLSVGTTATIGTGLTVTLGGITIAAGGLAVTAGGATITAGGLTVAAGGAAITGNSTIAGTLGGLTGLTVASGGATVSGTSIFNNALTVTGNFTANGGTTTLSGNVVVGTGIAITGNSTLATGSFTMSGAGSHVFVNTDGTNSTTISEAGQITIVTGSKSHVFETFSVTGTGTIGSIAGDGSGNTLYNTTSDERLKLDDGPLRDAGSIIDQLSARLFRWKASPCEPSQPGFMAQRVEVVFPWAVTKGVGEPGEDGFVPHQMDTSRFMPVVIAELQSLRRRLKAAGIS